MSTLSRDLRDVQAARPCYQLSNEPEVHRAIPVMVPALSWMASRWASTDWSLPESSWELSQIGANEHTSLATRR
jgi:hypothetical protein